MPATRRQLLSFGGTERPRARGYRVDLPAAFIPKGNGDAGDSTAFSWTGEALDKKTPLLRSMERLSTHALRIIRLFGNRGARRFHHRRPGTEYFLIDKNLLTPSDLINAGRTLFGAAAEGQELRISSASPGAYWPAWPVEAELFNVPVAQHQRVRRTSEIAQFSRIPTGDDSQMLTMEIRHR